MKKQSSTFLVASATLCLAATFGSAAEVEKTVAFRTADRTYVTAASKGGLNTQGRRIGHLQTFVLIDLNGGDLADGDRVQIKWAPAGEKPTYWHEGESALSRVKNLDDTCTFKIKLQAKSGADAPQPVVLQTASGKFVSVPTKGAELAATESQDKAATLDLVENPKPTTASKDAE